MADLVAHRQKRGRSPSPPLHPELTSPLDILLKRRRRDEMTAAREWDMENGMGGFGEMAFSYPIGGPSSSSLPFRLDTDGGSSSSGSSSGINAGWGFNQAGVERRRARQWERLQAPAGTGSTSRPPASSASLTSMQATPPDHHLASLHRRNNPFPAASQPTPDRYRNHAGGRYPQPYEDDSAAPSPSNMYNQNDFAYPGPRAASQPTPTPMAAPQNQHAMSSSPIRHHMPSSSPFRAQPSQSTTAMQGGHGFAIDGGGGTPLIQSLQIPPEEEWTAEEREREWGPVYAAQNSLLHSLHVARRTPDSRDISLASGSAHLLTPQYGDHDQSPSYFQMQAQSPLPSSHPSAALLPTPFQAPQPTPFRTLDSSSPHYSPLFPKHGTGYASGHGGYGTGDMPSTPMSAPAGTPFHDHHHGQQHTPMDGAERAQYEEANRLLAELEVARRQRYGYSEGEDAWKNGMAED